MKKYSKETLVHELNAINWNDILTCNDTNNAWLSFENIMLSVINKIAPIKQCRIKSRTQPWITSDIIESIQKRDKLLNQFHQSKDPTHYQHFCSIRNSVQRKVKLAKQNYIADQIEQNKDNPKKIWDSLKLLGYKYKPKTKNQIVLNVNDSVCHDPVTIAEHINNFFINVGYNLVSKLPNLPDLYSAFTEHCSTFYRNLGISPGTYSIQNVDRNFILKELQKLKPNKSTGLDDISPRFLRDGAHILSDVIMHLVNLSISSKTVPNCTKKAKVVPLYKKGSRLDVGNYRPVSILTSISKILERAVYVQVVEHCKSNNIIYPLQSGFQKHYSTDTCLMYLQDHIRSEISKGNFVGMMMLDVQKAFDSVDHTMLCEKIRLAGIDEKWFQSYLTGRTQVVNINDYYSNENTIVCGVPQGSLLGPWCYLIYSNDLPPCVSCKVILYADDTILLVSNKDLNIVKERLSQVGTTCFHWLCNNKLSMHMGKTEVIVFSSKRKQNHTRDFSIKMGEHNIKAKNSVKYLGLTMDNCLSGDSIVANIVAKTSARLKFCYRHKNSLNLHARKTLVTSLVQCYFDYAVSSWYSGLNKANRKKLQVAQNKLVRFILDLNPRSHIGQRELNQINFLNTQDRADQLMLGHMFNIYHQTAPAYLNQKFCAVSHHYGTRRATRNFFLPRPSKIDIANFAYQGAKKWNSLPINIKCINNKCDFKNKVRQWLKSNSLNNELEEFTM